MFEFIAGILVTVVIKILVSFFLNRLVMCGWLIGCLHSLTNFTLIDYPSFLLFYIGKNTRNRYNFVGFYRRNPLVANISSLCFECWHLALTSGYIIFRCVKLLIIIIVYIGRFDTPVLGHGVGEIGPVKLDAFPFIFRQDLLATDAHRHPFIERLGMMVRRKFFLSISGASESCDYYFLFHCK